MKWQLLEFESLKEEVGLKHVFKWYLDKTVYSSISKLVIWGKLEIEEEGLDSDVQLHVSFRTEETRQVLQTLPILSVQTYH